MTIKAQIFMGFLQNKELKVHLNKSLEWKEAKIGLSSPLQETRWADNDYIGIFLPSTLEYHFLKKKELEIKSQLQSYCPKLNLDNHPVCLFSQILLY